MKKKITITSFLLLTACCQIIAQSPPIIKAYHPNTSPVKQWDKTFGGTQYETGYGVELTDDNAYLLVGSSGSGISGNKQSLSKGSGDAWIVKVNQSGEKIWDKSYGGSLGDYAKMIIKCKDGGFLIGGGSNSPQSGDKSQGAHPYPNGSPSVDFWIFKIDAEGTKLWDKRYGGNGDDYLNCIIQTQDGGYLLAGDSNSNNGGDKTENLRGGNDAWVIKIDANGNKLWDKTLGGNKYESGGSLLELPDKTILVACDSSTEGTSGDITAPNLGENDLWLVKLSKSGGVLWDKKFGGTAEDRYPIMLGTNDGNIFINAWTNSPQSGSISSSPIGYHDFWLLKIDINGNKLWDKRYGGYGSESPPSIYKTFDNKYIMAGQTMSNAGYDISENARSDYDLWIIKIDDNGYRHWDKRIGPDNGYYQGNYILKPTTDLGFIFVTTSSANIGVDKTENSYGDNDMWAVKLGVNQLPEPICTTPYTGFVFVATGCSGTITWADGSVGVSLTTPELMETPLISATCTENGNTSQAASFKINVAWYQRIMAQDIVGGNNEYTAITTIEATNKIISPAAAKYIAGQSVVLNPGFRADTGSIFMATIKSCYE